MTRKEKEKILLDGLGLKVGDVVEIKYSEDMATDKRIIVEEDYCYYCSSIKHPELLKTITVLLYSDFTKLSPKKKKGNLICNECVCDKCPLCTSICGVTTSDVTLYDGLEKAKESKVVDDRVYSLFKEILDLDDEVEKRSLK